MNLACAVSISYSHRSWSVSAQFFSQPFNSVMAVNDQVLNDDIAVISACAGSAGSSSVM